MQAARKSKLGNFCGIATATIAALVAMSVFYVDAFTGIEGAVAVLYVIVLMLVAEVAELRTVVATVLACLIATVGAFLVNHEFTSGLPELLRFLVSIAAILITGATLSRSKADRQKLQNSNLALTESEARFRSVFERTRVALWERDYSAVKKNLARLKAQGVTDILEHLAADPLFIESNIRLPRTVSCNKAARELLGSTDTQIDPDLSARYTASGERTFLKVMQAVLDGKPHFEDQVTLLRPDGELRQVLVSVSIPDWNASFDRVVVSMLDVSDRHAMRQALDDAKSELQRASKVSALAVMSASLAHELTQPLQAIVVNAVTLRRWLTKSPPDLESASRTAERLERDTRRASEILSNTRRIVTRERDPDQMLDPIEVAIEAADIFQDEMHGLELVVIEKSPKSSAQYAVGHKLELQQVLLNLFANAQQAFEHSGVGSTITVGVSFDERFARLSVSDNGPGLSEEAVEGLFQPFRTTKPWGMGMGLAVSRSLLEARGASLRGSNKASGGTTFEIALPREGSIGAG